MVSRNCAELGEHSLLSGMDVAVPEEAMRKIFRAKKTMKPSNRNQLKCLRSSLHSPHTTPSQTQQAIVSVKLSEDAGTMAIDGEFNGTTNDTTPTVSSLTTTSVTTEMCARTSALMVASSKDTYVKDILENKIEGDKESTQPSPEGGKNMNAGSSCLSSGTTLHSTSSSPSPTHTEESDLDVRPGFLVLSEDDDVQDESEEESDQELSKFEDRRLDSMEINTKQPEPFESDDPVVCSSPSPMRLQIDEDVDSSDALQGKRALFGDSEDSGQELGGSDLDRPNKRPRIECEELEAHVEVKISRSADRQSQLKKVVQQLVDEQLRVLQITMFDRSLQELRDRMDHIEKRQMLYSNLKRLQAKFDRLSKKLGTANQARESPDERTEVLLLSASTDATTPADPTNTAPNSTPADPTNTAPNTTPADPTNTAPNTAFATSTAGSAIVGLRMLVKNLCNDERSPTPTHVSTVVTTFSTGSVSTSQTLMQSPCVTSTPVHSGYSFQPLLIQLPGGGTAILTNHTNSQFIPGSALTTGTNSTSKHTTTFILRRASSWSTPTATPRATTSAPKATTTNVTMATTTPIAASCATAKDTSSVAHIGAFGTVNTPSSGVSVSVCECSSLVSVVYSTSSASLPSLSMTDTTAQQAAPTQLALHVEPTVSLETGGHASKPRSDLPNTSKCTTSKAFIDLTEEDDDDDDVLVTGVLNAPVGMKASSMPSTAGQQTTVTQQATTSIEKKSVRFSLDHRLASSPQKDSPSKKAKDAKSSTTSTLVPPLPSLPPTVSLPLEAVNTNPPQQPHLKLTQVQNKTDGIVLSWSVTEVDVRCAAVDCYHLYAYHQDLHGPANSDTTQSSWKKIGEVTALALPMACTLTQFVSGSKYCFAVCARDVYGRFGPFCEPQCTDVLS
ncbi:hypothetical protein DPEC_G00280780 [Dallia pectoralis]|uniref:Uncharacterized protein n=1 Tax=Dallia pectoralis TaxID=75939 RepID=A0ACC2FMU3_DALPE|nr:hypothetical protein DPEC_G00280780 [Dallia pectoralis]